ncbi:YetF domain-containing protein, partial [Lactococcus lactis]|uniref:YetF domain-containing protein n=1 Tax=Lactococcus lactis TaxID=1358 RepID=UPI0025A1F33A
VAFFHVFVLCLNYTIVTLRFKDNINNVKRAILEQNGQLTLIEFGGENIKYPIIVDGQANFDVLELIDRDENWLEQQINLQGYNQIKEIYLGEYLSGELKLYGYTK